MPVPHALAEAPRETSGAKSAAALLVLLAAGASVVVYRGVLRSYFWSDDFVLLYMLSDLSLPEFLLTPYGGHTVVARNAVFALTHLVAGFDPRPYFATVVATHAVNVMLLGRLVWRLTESAMLAGAGALVWGICPTAGDSLSWYAAYAQVAATAFLLLAVDRLARHAGRRGALPTREVVIAGLWLCVSLLFFGSALAVALVWPIVIVLLFPETLADHRRLGAAVAVTVAVLVVYTGLQLLARTLYLAPDVSKVLGTFVDHPAGLVAFAQLAGVGVTSLALGAWWTPGVPADLVSWLALLLTAAISLAAFGLCGGVTRRTLTAFALIALAIYALTAVARAPAASVLLGWTADRVATTLRYHYAAQAFLVTALCVAAAGVAPRRPIGTRTAVLAWAALSILGVVRHGVEIDLHEPARSAVRDAFAEIEARVEATRPGETAYIQNRDVVGFGWVPNTMTPLPGLVGLFIIVSPADVLDGRPVRFVDSRPAVVEVVRQRGGRLARLTLPASPDAAAR